MKLRSVLQCACIVLKHTHEITACTPGGTQVLFARLWVMLVMKMIPETHFSQYSVCVCVCVCVCTCVHDHLLFSWKYHIIVARGGETVKE